MTYKSISTKMKASTGINKDMTDITKELTVSRVVTTGFASPPVAEVDANLVIPELPATAAAVPPPAMIANAQVIAGLKSATVDTITAVPAMVAKGIATVSSRLSI